MIGVLSRQFMSINIDDDLNVGVAPHLWTPSVEEQFSLVWPRMVLFLPKRWLLPWQANPRHMV